MTKEVVQDEHVYGIGAVAKLTGLTDHTIRVWERRYNAVVTKRSGNGRRIYTPADVEKLGLLKSLTDQGISIGKIAAGSVDELRQQVRSITEMATISAPDNIRVAILGDFLPGQLAARATDTSPVDVLIADSNRERFQADLRRHSVDVVVVESPILNSDTLTRLKEYMTAGGAQRAVVIYSFGRTGDVDQVKDSKIVVVRSPINVDEILAAVIRTYSRPLPMASRSKPVPQNQSTSEWQFAGPIAPRRFNQQQLANLANISSAIECECPQHLAQLVNDLSSFEIYSANCTNRGDEDAALHRYLHKTTAQARALMELALEKVAEAEGLTY